MVLVEGLLGRVPVFVLGLGVASSAAVGWGLEMQRAVPALMEVVRERHPLELLWKTVRTLKLIAQI